VLATWRLWPWATSHQRTRGPWPSGCPPPLEVLPEQAEAAFPPGATVWSLDSTDKDDPNHAVLLRFQLQRGVEEEALLLVLCKVLSSKFFDILRTQQQLGYIVGMGSQSGMSFLYITAQVQTEYPPDYTRGRIDAFFDEHFAWIEDGLSDEELQRCHAGVLSELKTKPKNLNEEFAFYNKQFLHRSYDFAHRAKLIAFLEKGMTLDTLRAYLREHVRPASRLYVQVKKVLEKEDKPLPDGASTPQDPPDLRRWSGEEAAGEFAGGARWVPLDAAVGGLA